ncbi:MAG: MFS transporter [Candidatus Lokiarchaeota archaeon]|nr:MFS transporter [Candidatus Lokiarchaeota archaeon]
MIVLEDLENQHIISEQTKKISKLYIINIRKIFIFQFFIGFYFLSGVIVPFYLNYAKFTLIDYNILQSYHYLLIFILEIPCGMIADYFGKRKSLILASFFSTIGALIYGLLINIYFFYIGETFFALGTALISGSTEALLHDSMKYQRLEKEFSKTIGKSSNIFLIGIIISSPIGSLIGSLISLQAVVILMSLPYFISLIIAFTIKEKLKPLKIKNRKNFIKQIKLGLKILGKSNIIKILLKEILIIEIIIFSLYINYQFYLLIELKISLIYYGFIEAMIIFSEVFFTYIISKKKIINSKHALLLVTLFLGILFVILGIISSIPLNLIIIIIILGLGFSRYIFFLNQFNKELDGENRALSFSVLNMIKMIPGIIIPMFGLIFLYNIKITFIIMGCSIIIFTLSSIRNYLK